MIASLALLLTAPSLRTLKSQLDNISEQFHGRLGYSVYALDSGESIGRREDERFPTASTIKVAIALEAVREVDSGKRTWSDLHELPPAAKRGVNDASEWTYFMKDGLKMNLDAYVNLMITYSDNLAARVLREWLGTVEIDKTLESLGLKDTRLLSSAPPEATALRRLNGQFGMGMTTPREMSRLLNLIYQRRAASPAASERLLRMMCHQYWDDLSGTTVPVGTSAAIKNGAISRSRSEVAIVFSPHPYILAIYTDNQKDQRWVRQNEGEETIRTMSKLIWSNREPNLHYAPPVGYERFLPTGGGVEAP